MKNSEIPFGYEKEGKIYLKAWSNHKDREIGVVTNEDISGTVSTLIEKFDDFKQKVETVTQKIDENENKGSFLMKLVHLKDLIPTHEGLGDYAGLFEKLEKYESLVRDIIKKNRERNSEIKTALIEELKVAVEEVNWKVGTEKVNDLKSRWIKTGNAEEEKNKDLEATFWDTVKDFFERKKGFFEDKQKLTELRKTQYEQLVDDAKKLVDLKKEARFEKSKELREKWKEVGGVPSEIYKPLIEEFNSALKQRPQHSQTDYKDILKSLEEIKVGQAVFKKEEVELLKKNVFRDKTRSKDKSMVLELIQLLSERHFIQGVISKRFKDYSKFDLEKKRNIQIKVIKDLIKRDTDELKIFEENSTNFVSKSGEMNKMVEGKLKSQKRKITIKEKLLDWVDSNHF